jgi:hypothetical protein
LYEFDLIINVENSYEKFEEAFADWKTAILDYALATASQPRLLKHALRDYVPGDLDAGIFPVHCHSGCSLFFLQRWSL